MSRPCYKYLYEELRKDIIRLESDLMQDFYADVTPRRELRHILKSDKLRREEEEVDISRG